MDIDRSLAQLSIDTFLTVSANYDRSRDKSTKDEDEVKKYWRSRQEETESETALAILKKHNLRLFESEQNNIKKMWLIIVESIDRMYTLLDQFDK